MALITTPKWRELGAIIEAAAWRALVRKATETRSTGKKHLFDSGGKIEVAAHPVKTGHAIGGTSDSAKPGVAVRPASMMALAGISHGGKTTHLSWARETRCKPLLYAGPSKGWGIPAGAVETPTSIPVESTGAIKSAHVASGEQSQLA